VPRPANGNGFEPTGCAVMLCDLDAFKQVNDRYGHATGDAIMCRVADRLTGLVLADDVKARGATLGARRVDVLYGPRSDNVNGRPVDDRSREARVRHADIPTPDPASTPGRLLSAADHSN
jgi:hypothetical protein